MTWIEWHQQSEKLASAAMVAYRANDFDRARALYGQAAEAEQKALNDLELGKPRTKGVTAVSAVSLWFKAGDYKKAEQLAYLMLLKSTLFTGHAIQQRKWCWGA